MPPTTSTLGEALERAARSDHGLTFLDRKENETVVPWSEVLTRARRVAGGLLALGVEAGDRVAVVFPTGPGFFDAFFGATLAGAVPVPLYPPVRLGRMDEYHARTAAMLRASGARLVLSDKQVWRVIGQAIREAAPALGCLRLDELPLAAAPRAVVAPDDLAMVQFSSGTTVEPKPVALSHRAVLAQTDVIIEWGGAHFAERQAGVCWLPLYHDMGLIGCVFVALRFPGSLTLIGPEVFIAQPAIWLRALSRSGACISPAPNFAYALCVERIRDEELDGVDLSGWTLALNGAEPVAPGVLRAFQARFARWGLSPTALTPVYGLSEASLAVTFSDPDAPFATRHYDRQRLARGEAVLAEDGDRVAGGGPRVQAPGVQDAGVEIASVGRPAPRFEVQVRDEDGNELEMGRVGRVWARGPSLMTEYLGRPEDTARTLVQGWLDTGDLGFLFEGELYLTGRAKDVLILRGRNHAPHPVEQAVDGVAGVRTGCAAAVSHLPEGAAGEVLWLFVEHKKAATAAELAALSEACARAVMDTAQLAVDEVIVLSPGTLPRTSSGKIRRREALERYRAGELLPPEKVGLVRVAGMMVGSALAHARAERGRK